MKSYSLPSLTVTLLLAGNISIAQNSILAGKIVDKNNKPVPGAIISLNKQRDVIQEIKADGDGLFSGKLMAAGDYSLSVTTNRRKLKLNDFILDPESGSERYYIIKVANNKLVINKVNDDPSIKVKLARIEKSKHDALDNGYIIKVDSTGKPTSMQGPAGGPPRMK